MGSNTATILAMMPVAEAFLGTLPQGNERFAGGFLLAIGYSATIGGIATPVGTPTNAIFLGQFSQFWPSEGDFPFAKFVACAAPLSGILLFVTWLGACAAYIWRSPEPIKVDRARFREYSESLGKWTFEEMVIAVDLLALILLWFTASPLGSFPGWKASVAPGLDSGSIGLMMVLPLFFIPCGARLPVVFRRVLGNDRCSSEVAPDAEPRHILDWDALAGNFKWEILFVFGAGYMVALGTTESGLAQAIAELLTGGLGEFALLALVTTITCFTTEVVSNMATVSIFGPIIVAAAKQQRFDPVLLLLAVTLSSSFAFMLPMAGGPNMTVYSTKRVSVPFVARNGFALNVAACILGSVYMFFGMSAFLGSYKSLPPAAR